MNGLALRIQNALLEGDVDAGLHALLHLSGCAALWRLVAPRTSIEQIWLRDLAAVQRRAYLERHE